MRGMDRRLAAPESEAFTLSDSSLQLTKARSNFQLDSGKGIRLPETTEANPLTIGSEGEMRKGRLESRRAPTAVPPGARARPTGSSQSSGFRRPEEGSKPGGPEAKSLEVPWRPEDRGCARNGPVARGPGPSRRQVQPQPPPPAGPAPSTWYPRQ